MPATNAFADYCAELLAPLGRTRVKHMFGGHGIYVDDIFIAIVVGETLYLKADDQSMARFDAAACKPFTFEAKGRTMTTHYRAAPAEAMDSPALMRPWAVLARDAALRARK
jgi:DNA transformation protein